MCKSLIYNIYFQHLISLTENTVFYARNSTRLSTIFSGKFSCLPPPLPFYSLLTFSSPEQVFIQAKDRYISNELPASATLVFSICRSKDRKTKEILTFHFLQIFHIKFVRFVIIPAVFSLLPN